MDVQVLFNHSSYGCSCLCVFVYVCVCVCVCMCMCVYLQDEVLLKVMNDFSNMETFGH